jgi:serine/threonine protein kinase
MTDGATIPPDAIARLADAAARPTMAGGRYTLGALVGRGGMGSVYVARDILLDRDVAIKVSGIPIDGRPADDARLIAEAMVLARLEHPGIVPVHDTGVTADGRRFYAMKLVRGDTLAEHFPRLHDLGAALSVIERAADAVAFAHAAGVTHRDLSPNNIMIGGFGEVLVLDWGLAERAASAASGAAAGPGVRAGTRGYMAPELADGLIERAGPPADVFALGALLGEALAATGRPVPRRLRAIVDKCRSVDPAARYADAGALAADLARFRAGGAVTAHRDTRWEQAAAWFSRHRLLVGLVAAYLLMRAAFAFLG